MLSAQFVPSKSKKRESVSAIVPMYLSLFVCLFACLVGWWEWVGQLVGWDC